MGGFWGCGKRIRFGSRIFSFCDDLDFVRYNEKVLLVQVKIMSDLNRGIMKFDGADSAPAVVVSAIVVLGSVAALLVWALMSAYAT
jgi:hypothetical protein